MINQTGFTLIELLMVLVITSILLSIGSSGYQRTLERAKVNHITQLLAGDIEYGKQYAGLNLGEHLMCANNDCDSSDWSQGWSLRARDTVVRTFHNSSNISVTKNLSSSLSFDLFGRLNQGLGTSFYVCGAFYGKRIVLNRAARIRIEDYQCS